MTVHEYQHAAARTCNPALSTTARVTNGALGLCGEAGEVADIVKKHMMQGHPLDTEHIAKELGDILWYVVETCTAIGYDLETIMEMNIEKLKKRYPYGFEASRSMHREKNDI
jgi:NTP pyrophosphatase (non-canonical NTP hydrolase)